MDERTILHKLSRGNQRVLEAIIKKYSSYVVTVIHNRSRGLLSPEDEEEIASDVFLSLWLNAAKIQPGRIRPWLVSVAKNKTADRMRQKKLTVPLEDHTIIVDDPQWESLSRKEQARQVRQALKNMKPTDREIFYRYYDLCETTTQIAAALNMPPSTVRTRLSRGRKALRTTLCQGGFSYENSN